MRIASSAVRSGTPSSMSWSCVVWSSCSSGAWSSGMVIGARLSQIDRGALLVVGCAGRRLWSSSAGSSARATTSSSNSSGTSTSPSSVPVQRMCSSPSGVDLVERDRTLAVELEQREEAGDHDQGALAVGGQRPEGRSCATAAASVTRIAACSRTLTAGRAGASMRQVGTGLGAKAPRRQGRELLRPQPEQHLRAAGRRAAARGSPTAANRPASSAIRPAKTAAACL